MTDDTDLVVAYTHIQGGDGDIMVAGPRALYSFLGSPGAIPVQPYTRLSRDDARESLPYTKADTPPDGNTPKDSAASVRLLSGVEGLETLL